MEAQTIFLEKVAINLIANLSKSYAYERSFNQVLQYRGYVFQGSGEWFENVLIKLNEHKKNRKRKSKLAEEFDFPVAPVDYLTEGDIHDMIAHILEAQPELKEPFQVEPNVTMLGDLLDLTEIERLILQMSIYANGRMNYPWENMLSSITVASEFDEPGRIYEVMFNLDAKEVTKSLQGFLFNSGLLVPLKRIKNIHVVAPEMAETFCDRTITTGSIGDSLFPSCLTTDLTVDDYPHVSSEIGRAETIIGKSLIGRTKGINVMFWGMPGTGKTELALAMAKKHGWDLKVIGDSSKQDMSEKSRAQRLTSLKMAMKLYQNSDNVVLLFDEMEDLFKADNNAQFSKAFINRIIETTPIPIIWTTNDIFSMGNAVLRRMTYNISFEVPPRAARKQIWETYAAKHDVKLPDETIEQLAADYDITPALISNAVKIAALADLQDPEAVSHVVKSLDRLVHYGAKRQFKPAAMKDTPYNPAWVNSKTDLTKLTAQLLTAKPCFSLLLYGAPGTGKSEFGRYLAKKLGKAVLFKRASDLQSMWVGECEKNIARMFEEAKQEEKLIILDEGDTYLQNREGAQRNWEVSQVNEMLSQMESHTQPFIMTTNLMTNLDPAAMRRFIFKMEFKFLRADQVADMFSAYFNQVAPAKLLKLDVLAPGDFAAVKKRADIVGETDSMALAEMLIEEAELKPQFRKLNVGF